MTEDEKIAVLRGMVDDEDSDSVLSVYLKIAGERILRKSYPFDDAIKKVPDKYYMLQCEIAAYLCTFGTALCSPIHHIFLPI